MRLPTQGSFLPSDKGFAKGSEFGADLSIPDPMKFLVSQMAGLKLRLLDRTNQARKKLDVVDSLLDRRTEPDKMIVCQAVEDRICRRVDLASRTDLTDRQALDALRLLFKIVRSNALPVDFSPAELFLLTHGIEHRLLQSMTRLTQSAIARL